MVPAPSSAPRGLWGRWRRRLAALACGIVLAPVAVELALRSAALLVERDRAAGAGAALVLCQGDSNTFGLYLQGEHSYPGQLDALIRERGGAAGETFVANRGVPGKPTWLLLDEIEGDLERYSPRAVVLMAGVNDRTALRPPPGEEPSFLASLRIVKLARLLRAHAREESDASSAGAPDPDDVLWVDQQDIQTGGGVQKIEFVDRTGTALAFELVGGLPSKAEYQAWIAEDIAAAVELARDAGADPIVMLYPAIKGAYDDANLGLVEAARRAGVTPLDPRPDFARAAALVGQDALLYRDGHPTRLGYSILARLVFNALRERGLVAADAPLDPLEVVRAFQPAEIALQPWVENGALRGVAARYEPGWGAVLLVARERGESAVATASFGRLRAPEADDAARPIPLADDDLLRWSLRAQPEPPETFDRDGSARLALPEPPPGGWPPSLQACVVVVGPKASSPAVAGPLALALE
jgi:lysophospholipase L1-like esterase